MSQYRELIYATYTTNIHSFVNRLDEAGNKEYAKAMLRIYGGFLPADRDAAILDAGCGTGRFLSALKTAGYTNCQGIDISQEQVDIAKNSGLDVTQTDTFEFLKDKKDQYDVILAKDFVEHLFKDEVIDLVTLSFQALKPGGSFICNVPNADSPFAMRSRYKDLTHELIFTQESLRQLFLACGLEPACIIGEVYGPTALKGWIRFSLLRTLRFFWRIFMFAEFGPRAYQMPLEATLIGVARK